MDPTQKIEPHRVTKPMQLLAAWLIGMIVVQGALLTAACVIEQPTWAPGALVIAAILNIPLFLFCMFLLQTKFRPELQEDIFYSKWLDRKVSITEFGAIKEQNLYRPYVFSKETTREQRHEVEEEIVRWHPILVDMEAPGFFAMHAWYYEKEQYIESLTCLDIAIARGMVSSKNLSFRAANLKLLGRLLEAKYSAELALELDPNNIDASFNLALIYRDMGLEKESLMQLQKVLDADEHAYNGRIRYNFPNVVNKKTAEIEIAPTLD